MQKASERIRELAKKRWPEDTQENFLAACILNHLSSRTAENIWNGTMKPPQKTTMEIVARILRAKVKDVFDHPLV